MKKITIAEIDIDYGEAQKESAKLLNEIEKLKSQMREAKKSGQPLTEEYVEQSAKVKALQQEYRIHETTLKSVVSSETTQLGTLQKLKVENAALRAEQQKLNLTTEEGRKRNEEIVSQINKNTEAISANSDANVQNKMNIGNYESALSGLPGPLGKVSSGIMGMTKTAKAFIATPLGLILGGVALAVGAVTAAFKLFASTDTGSTEIEAHWEGLKAQMDDFRRSILDGNWARVWDLITGKAKESREATMEYVRALDVINDRIALQKANIEILNTEIEREKVLSKDMMLSSEERLKHAEKAYAIRGNLLELERKNVEDNYNLELKRLAGVSGVSEEVLKQYAFATEEEQNLLVKNNERLAAFRENSDSELFKLVEVAAQKQKVETDYHRESRRLVTELSNTKKQALNDEINDVKATYERKLSVLKAERNYMNDDFYYNLKQDRKQFEAEIERDRKTLQESATILTVNEYNIRYNEIKQRQKEFYANQRKEANAHEAKLEEERVKALELAAQEKLKSLKTEIELYKQRNKSIISSEDLLTEDLMKKESERLDSINEKELDSLKFSLDNNLITQNEYDLELIKLEESLLKSKDELRKSYDIQEKERKISDFENEMAIAEGQIFQELEMEKRGLDLKEQQEIQAAERVGASTELIEKKYSKARQEIARAEQNAKLSLASGFTDNLATIFGEQTAIGKAAAVASTTIKTYQSAQAAYASMVGIPVVGPALGVAAAGAAVASGLANVKKILAVNPNSPTAPISSSASSQFSQVSAPKSVEQSSTTTDTEIGRGLVSRNNFDLQKSQAVLVVDDVTSSQMNNRMKENLSII